MRVIEGEILGLGLIGLLQGVKTSFWLEQSHVLNEGSIRSSDREFTAVLGLTGP